MNWINILEHTSESCHTLLDFYWCVQNLVYPVKEILLICGTSFLIWYFHETLPNCCNCWIWTSQEEITDILGVKFKRIFGQMDHLQEGQFWKYKNCLVVMPS